MWFNDGGAIDFGRAMLQAGRLGRYQYIRTCAMTAKNPQIFHSIIVLAYQEDSIQWVRGDMFYIFDN